MNVKTTPIVVLNGLRVEYPGKVAVQDLSLSLAPGEVLGILGPNGSGKTTTVSCIEGLTVPSSGTVDVFSMDPLRHREAVYARLGVQLQEANYPLRIRVDELCALFSSFYAHPADWRALLRTVGLESAARRSVQKLSGGERQKLSVVLALVGRPELLILDEVSTGLDPHARRALHNSLRQIAEQGTAMILITHYPDELAELADRILLLDGGTQRFLGSPDAFVRWAASESGAASGGRLTLEEAYLSVCSAGSELQLEVMS